ncbi:PA0069 family radical SAM protein [Phycisphaerales bacterium AB-hyl4]|uniref:PA0069 family radical SAM protein n=1 Tax=Natronomicrosphaera hydrolytica TaxID=3242702 RepID=A0ABV4U7B9_9BACT
MDEAFEYCDGLPNGPVRGRGAGLNPGNRFEDVRLHVLGEHLDAVLVEHDAQRQVTTRVLRDQSRTLINYVDPAKSPDIGFRWTINPYRGCEHGCIYCYARPGHEYLGLSSGLDFETTILAKLDAPALLERELDKATWQGEPIVMAGVTDVYQPIEAKLRLTRGLLEVMARCRQPVSLITKNKLILRDLDLLMELAKHDAVHAAVSLTTLDATLAQRMEPRASHPRDRLEAIRQLSAAGVPVTVMAAPIIPGLNDRELPALLKAAAEAGATSAGYVLLRLPYQIKALFLDWLARHYPQRAGKVESFIRQARGGELYEATHGKRMRGEGAMAEQIGDVFRLFRRRYGLTGQRHALSSDAFVRPNRDGQMSLF